MGCVDSHDADTVSNPKKVANSSPNYKTLSETPTNKEKPNEKTIEIQATTKGGYAATETQIIINKGDESETPPPNLKIESNYFPKGGYSTTEIKLCPIARILLIGVYDDDNLLSTFRGMRYIIRKIWTLAMEFNKISYGKYIETVNPDYYFRPTDFHAFKEMDTFQVHGRCGTPEPLELKFPEPLGEEININMMPILMNEDELKKQIPEKLQGYVEWVRACFLTHEFNQYEDHHLSSNGRIFYLTIHESFVEKGKTQRRPGLHTENPGSVGYGIDGICEIAWGGGYNLKDGVFMASNVSGSCVAWNCRILDDKYMEQRRIQDSKRYYRARVTDWNEQLSDNKLMAIGNMGNVEHLRGILPVDTKCELEANKLYWMTDRTPHEALPMKKSGWRQFFRLVSSKLSVWYEDHSTKNPIGIKPDEKITKIIKGNKFV